MKIIKFLQYKLKKPNLNHFYNFNESVKIKKIEYPNIKLIINSCNGKYDLWDISLLSLLFILFRESFIKSDDSL